MGNDADIHIVKKRYSEKAIEKLLRMMDYEKYGKIFYCGNDDEYKYFSGIKVWKYNEDEKETVYRILTQVWASGYDIQKQNDTLKNLKKYCGAWFDGDMGKNRYFETRRLVKGAESGCYFAIQNLDNCFSMLSYALEKYPLDEEAEKKMMELGVMPTPSSFNANIYLSYLCSLMEDFFRETFVALIKYSDKKEKLLNVKFSSYDMVEISEKKKTVEEAYARTLSFQNIHKITSHFRTLNGKLDICKPLRKPYHGRKEQLYSQIDRIFERRHGMVHRKAVDPYYDAESLKRDIKDVKVAFIRVYEYICSQYGWEPEEIVL